MPYDSYDKPLTDRSIITRSIRTYSDGDTDVSDATTLGPLINYEGRARSWGNTPNFKALRKTGLPLPDNGYSFTSYRKSPVRLYMKSESRFADTGSPGMLLYAFDSKSYNLAYLLPNPNFSRTLPDSVLASQLHNKAKGLQFSTPLFIREISQTTGLIGDYATRLVSTIRSLRRGDIRTASKSLFGANHNRLTDGEIRTFNKKFGSDPLSTASDQFLAWKYGVVPLMEDVRTLTDLLPQLHARESQKDLAVVRARKRIDYRDSKLDEDIEITPRTWCVRESQIEESVRGIWRIRVKPLNVLGQLGLTNPIEFLYQAYPLSFVSDWFFPIGAWLGNLDVDLRFQSLSAVYGYRRKVTNNFHSFYGSWHEYSNSTAVSENVTVTRIPDGGVPYVPFPSKLRFDLGVDKTVSILAILQQNFRSNK